MISKINRNYGSSMTTSVFLRPSSKQEQLEQREVLRQLIPPNYFEQVMTLYDGYY